MHMDTEWVTVKRSTVLDNRNRHIEQSGLTFRAGSEINHSTFAFSCLPYTAEELENATHQEELPPERRTVLCIYGAVRGVGGIDSWGSDVEEQYRIPGNKDIEVEFIMKICFSGNYQMCIDTSLGEDYVLNTVLDLVKNVNRHVSESRAE